MIAVLAGQESIASHFVSYAMSHVWATPHVIGLRLLNPSSVWVWDLSHAKMTHIHIRSVFRNFIEWGKLKNKIKLKRNNNILFFNFNGVQS